MKKLFKILILMLVIIPSILLMSGCVKQDDLDSLRIVDIKQERVTADNVTYTITYEDGSTFSYEVPLNNVVSIDTIQKTATSNNKDTYTITLTNGDTHEFEVNHGVTVTEINYDRTDGLKDYYTINYNNGQTTEFYVTNGENGTDGKSVTGIEFEYSNGLTDYYKISYSDNTYTYFTVKNGEDGVTLEELYETANKDGKYSNILEFIEDYLSININKSSSTIAAGKAVMSAVSVYAFSPVSGSYYEYKYGSYNYYSASAGSGVIYQLDKAKGDAYIITNCHVVYSENNAVGTDFATKVVCYLYGQESGYYLEKDDDEFVYDSNMYPVINCGQYGIECEVIGASTVYDIAVLKVSNSDVLKNSNAKQVDVKNSDTVILCEDAIAIGNPDAEGISVTQGVVSVLSEYIQVSIDSKEASILREFRMDTAVNGGNSGGGLFNNEGKLIGIVNAKTSDNTLENMGYAIPSNIAINVADNMIYYHESNNEFALKKAYFGIKLGVKSSRTEYNASTLTTDIIEEVYISYIEADSVSEKQFKLDKEAVVKSVTIFNGEDTKIYNITRYHQLIDLVLTIREGDLVTFNCVFEGQAKSYSYTFQAKDFIKIN